MVADGGPEGGEAREDGVDESAADTLAGGTGRSQVRAARRRRRLKIVALAAAGVLVVAVGLGAYGYEWIFGRIRSISLSGLTHRPAASKPNAEGQTPLNILVLGSQTRDGQHGVNLGNSSKGGTNLSDTAMLVHLSADRRWSVVASIPRDLVVPRPSATPGSASATRPATPSSPVRAATCSTRR